MVSLPGVPSLTEEQLAILETCPPSRPLEQQVARRPQNNSDDGIRRQLFQQKGQLTRITAAAGSGKTTTLLALALHAAKLGHSHLTYVTFTNAAASDGKERLNRVLAQEAEAAAAVGNPQAAPTTVIDARTLHSCAHRLLQDHLNQERARELALQTTREAAAAVVEEPRKIWSEKGIKRWITKECRAEIDDFLAPCFSELRRRADPDSRRGAIVVLHDDLENRAREQVEFFIFKSLVHFCQSSWTLEEYAEGTMFNRDYYPAKIFHQARGKGEEYGFLPTVYSQKQMYGFYADQAARLWKMIVREDIRSFDFEMKRVQLLNLRVPGSILLVDESQDMDACQIDFIARQQVEFGTHVYVVGDAVQSIYGFRGARPGFLLNLRGDIDRMLTESWRFGPAISNIANFILYAKEHSEQTATTYDGKPKNWIPYRTKPGIPDLPSQVTTKSLIGEWRKMKITIIARTNATLLLEALGVLGFIFDIEDDDNSDDEQEGNEDLPAAIPPNVNNGSRPSVPIVTPDDDDEEYYETVTNEPEIGVQNPSPLYTGDLPKIHINGRGESSGLRLWKKNLQLIESVYGLYELWKEDRTAVKELDPKLFPDFVRKRVNWHSFVDECTNKELSRYNNVIQIVRKCRNNTMAAIETFRKHVLEHRFSADESHIILTTCHSAKGCEWDNIHVCNDFVRFADFKKKSQKTSRHDSPFKKPRIMDQYDFAFQGWGDDVNLAYVACTRAKRLLSIPECIRTAVESLDSVHRFLHKDGDKVNKVAITIPGQKTPLSEREAGGFHESLVVPLRKELNLAENDQLLVAALIESSDEDTEATNGDSSE